jgi:hypothetical protein
MVDQQQRIMIIINGISLRFIPLPFREVFLTQVVSIQVHKCMVNTAEMNNIHPHRFNILWITYESGHEGIWTPDL